MRENVVGINEGKCVVVVGGVRSVGEEDVQNEPEEEGARWLVLTDTEGVSSRWSKIILTRPSYLAPTRGPSSPLGVVSFSPMQTPSWQPPLRLRVRSAVKKGSWQISVSGGEQERGDQGFGCGGRGGKQTRADVSNKTPGGSGHP